MEPEGDGSGQDRTEVEPRTKPSRAGPGLNEARSDRSAPPEGRGSTGCHCGRAAKETQRRSHKEQGTQRYSVRFTVVFDDTLVGGRLIGAVPIRGVVQDEESKERKQNRENEDRSGLWRARTPIPHGSIVETTYLASTGSKVLCGQDFCESRGKGAIQADLQIASNTGLHRRRNIESHAGLPGRDLEQRLDRRRIE